MTAFAIAGKAWVTDDVRQHVTEYLEHPDRIRVGVPKGPERIGLRVTATIGRPVAHFVLGEKNVYMPADRRRLRDRQFLGTTTTRTLLPEARKIPVQRDAYVQALRFLDAVVQVLAADGRLAPVVTDLRVEWNDGEMQATDGPRSGARVEFMSVSDLLHGC